MIIGRWLALVSLAFTSNAVAQDDQSAATEQAVRILRSLSSESQPILFQPSFVRYTGGEYPTLGIAGYATPDGKGDLMEFISCGGDRKQVAKSDLDATLEFCPEDATERPITIVLGPTTLQIYGGDKGNAFAFQSPPVADLGSAWSDAAQATWLEKAKEASKAAGASASTVESANRIVVQEMSVGGSSVISVGIPTDIGSYVVWKELPPNLGGVPGLENMAPLGTEGLS